ncbi:MAG: hypothetical protein AAB421_01250 [Patescibacteria group bacterium]
MTTHICVQKVVVGLLLSLVILPLISHAQTSAELESEIKVLLDRIKMLQNDLGGQPTNTNTTPYLKNTPSSSNTNLESGSLLHGGLFLTRDIARGSNGEDVARLQSFLAQDFSIYPEGVVSGRYLSLTETAVRRFQVSCGIVSVGEYTSTGYGRVGPRTRKALAEGCPSVIPTEVGAFIRVEPISGGAPLTVTATATVNTSRSCERSSYLLDFGDGTTPFELSVPATRCVEMTQSIAHTYALPGSYLVTLSSGAHKTAVTVRVADAPPTQSKTIFPDSLTASPLSGVAPLSVNFSVRVNGAASCGGGEYTLDFGDGDRIPLVYPGDSCRPTEFSITHRYDTPGAKVVKLYPLPTTQVGAYTNAARVETVSVSEAASGFASANDLSVVPGFGGVVRQVQARFTLENGCTGFTLDWGDGSTPITRAHTTVGCNASTDAQEHVHTYPSAQGTIPYTLRLSYGPPGSQLSRTARIQIVGVLRTDLACTFNGQEYPHGTILPFSPVSSSGVDYSRSRTAAFVLTNAASAVACVVGCGPGILVRYKCDNGAWTRVETGTPYPYPYPIALKPVIYLYPTQTQEVTVGLQFKGTLSTTYPEYDDAIGGWRVTAHPDGTLISNAREYSYLFWEGAHYPIGVDETHGFVVKGSETRAFLQTTLAKLGLTPREYNEFIVFWLPKMQHNPYNFIHFVGSAYTESAPLTISPQPDSVLRVFMAFKPRDTFTEVVPQNLQSFTRTGFSVIEWGGMEY